jgi:hypothetical integral membrane protein (TIGR02206 family)
MFEILLFWVVLGTTQGILTPDIAVGFPSFDYFRYWIVHLGVLFLIIYAIRVFRWRPTFISIFKSFFALQVYFIFTVVINTILDANYCYLNRKPDASSILDYLGDWPNYVLIIELLLLPLFFIVYLPFYFLNKKMKQ